MPKQIKCKRCKRVLTNPIYAKLGVGKICAAKLGIELPVVVKPKKSAKKKKFRKLGKIRRGGMHVEKNKVDSPLQLKLQFKDKES